MAALPPTPTPPSGFPTPPPLAPGYTEHKAPTGHTYYYNKATGHSTYVRPIAQPEASPNALGLSPPTPPPPPNPLGPQHVLGAIQNVSLAGNYNHRYGQPSTPPLHPFNPPQQGFAHGTAHHQARGERFARGGPRGGHSSFAERRKQPEDRPKHRYDIPNCAPWVLVKTKLRRRFVWNKETNESFWNFPQDVLKAVVEFDRMEREKKERRLRGEPSEEEDNLEEERAEATVAEAPGRSREASYVAADQEVGDDSEYEEVEVTDEEEGGDENPSKRQRTEEQSEEAPLEMGEDDIAWQLAAMEEGYEEEEEELLTEDDCKALFKDLLEDLNTNPYSPWEKVLEDGALYDDDRYKALPTMKARKECWDEWSRDKIQLLKELRAKQEKKDPRIPYMAFLQKYATPKLFWPEFRRKYKKEPEMKDAKLSDKEREKAYREHINRLKLPQSTLKADLSALLKAQPLSALNRSTTFEILPTSVLIDIRFISLPSSVRDQLVQTYISTLPLALEGAAQSAEEEAEAAKKRAEKERRQKALADREKRVQDAQRKQRRDLEFGKNRLREEEEEISRAMKVGKGGLKGQLAGSVEESS